MTWQELNRFPDNLYQRKTYTKNAIKSSSWYNGVQMGAHCDRGDAVVLTLEKGNLKPYGIDLTKTLH